MEALLETHVNSKMTKDHNIPERIDSAKVQVISKILTSSILIFQMTTSHIRLHPQNPEINFSHMAKSKKK